MSGSASDFSPRYVRLSGEIADQAVLDGLRRAFPAASIGHAYASTEAGVGFAVNDGLEGFPADMIGVTRDGVEMKVEDGSLRIRSKRTAHAYVGRQAAALTDARDSSTPATWSSCAATATTSSAGAAASSILAASRFIPRKSRRSSTGMPRCGCPAPIAPQPDHRRHRGRRCDLADGDGADRSDEIRDEILADCRASLASHKVPAVIRFVASLDVTAAGKLARHDA
jgi:hypothetical protein